MEYVLSQRNFEEVLNQWRDQISPRLENESVIQVSWSIPMICGLKLIYWLRPGLIFGS
jgi:hypothetical protein